MGRQSDEDAKKEKPTGHLMRSNMDAPIETLEKYVLGMCIGFDDGDRVVSTKGLLGVGVKDRHDNSREISV